MILTVSPVLRARLLFPIFFRSTGDTVKMALGGMEMKVGAYDGVLAYGLVHLLRAIAELVEDVERGVPHRAP